MTPARALRLTLALMIAAPAAFAQAPGGAGVPVTTVLPVRVDVPVTVRAIGTVQAFQSVVIRARVDGTLDKVFFTEGQQVKPGDLLAQLDPRPYQAVLDQALAKRAADEAMLANSRGDLVRYADLAQSQATSRQRLDLQRANVAQAEATMRGSDAAIAAAQLNLSFTRITSPIEGRVGLKLLDPGNYIRAADTGSPGIVTVAQIHPIALIYTLPQDVLPRLQQAMRAGKPMVEAYTSDDRTRLSEGELLTIDSTIDIATGTIKAKAVFINMDDNLWPGQFVNVRTRLDVRRDALTLPSAAIQRGQSGLFVFVVKPDNTAALQPVELSQDDGVTAVVSRGLDGAERVVLAGQSRLAVGTRVAATDAKPAS
ncbi:MAG: efflux RND transporter periplasmic adaptor subunit [Gemmatimonadaceae bacterium]|nr:efflux RND transporter periplasmic adaptor subunit [Acetobacteraceae bacterium]